MSSLLLFSEAPGLGMVWTDDPPLDVSGMTLVKLNPRGRLTQLIAIPPQVEKAEGAASSPDWAPLFSAAGLDFSKWLPAQPAWIPPVYSDARGAWTGSLAERPDIPMRIEAAAYRGKPVYFELIGPWTRPERGPYALRGTPGRPGEFHPEALSELYMNLSAHTAPTMEPRRTPICQ
jgi:hypothetical protein